MLNLLDLPHAEARRLVSTGAPVYLPVNPVEFHGPHLSLHNDALVSQGLLRDLHARLLVHHPEWPLLAVSDLELGVDPVPGPGTRAVPFAEACAAIERACGALADLGAKRVVLVTFHGSPLHAAALETGVELLRRRGVQVVQPFNVVLQELIRLDPARYAAAAAFVPESDREVVLRELPIDFHAGFFETSMALHYAPESVAAGYRELAPCPSFAPPAWIARAAALGGPEVAFAAQAAGWYRLRPFPGYTGRPHLASAEAGAVFAREIVDRYERVVVDVFEGRAESPRPILSWMKAATLGGRIPGPSVPPEAWAQTVEQ